jgi:hypothetical protein
MACFCEYPYQISALVSNLAPGAYELKVYREKVDAGALLHEESVEIGG